MEQFASVSGISRPTLSKYFHDPDSVRASTRARIEEALDRFDYRPNIYAINQNRRLTKNVGIVVPYLADPFFAEIAPNDPHWTALKAAADEAKSRPAAWREQARIYGDLGQDERFAEDFTGWMGHLHADGTATTLEAYVRDARG